MSRCDERLVRVGDTVRVQHRKGGRVFYSRVHDVHTECGIEVATVTDPRNGGHYTLPTHLMRPANETTRGATR